MTRELFGQMISGAVSSIRAHQLLLSELDSVAGDGDHGTTMVRVMETLEQSFGSGVSTDLHACLRQAGWDVLCVDGGAASSIVGTFFLGIGDGPETGDIDTLFQAGLVAVQRYTNATTGDKTMMDALMPAVRALHDAARSGNSESEAVRAAARAAQAGAESTKSMTSRFGRAKFAGERTRGYADPGAMSIALLFEGFANGIDKFLKGAPGGGHG